MVCSALGFGNQKVLSYGCFQEYRSPLHTVIRYSENPKAEPCILETTTCFFNKFEVTA